MIEPTKATGLLDDIDVLRLLDDANHAMVAAGVGAKLAGIDVGDAVAGRAVRDAILDVANGIAQPLSLLVRRFQDVKRQPLRALGANARQTLELIDKILN